MIDTSAFQGKKAAYYTLGCKLNFSETSTFGKTLADMGVITAAKGEQADICLINTCSVTEVADKKCRQAIHRLYAERLADLPGITVTEPRGETPFLPNYWLTTIKVDREEAGFTPASLGERLAQADIESRPLWKPLHLQPVFASSPAYVNGVAEAQFNCGLCLPSGPMVSDEDVERVVAVIRDMR